MANGSVKIDGARFIATMDQERRIIRNGSIVIEGSRITQVGKAADLAGVTADRVIDASDMVVTPGLINGHQHISYHHVTRGVYPDDLNLGQYLGLSGKIAAVMSEDEEYHTTLLGITELLKYGTTCFLDAGSTIHLEACMKAYEESGIRAVVGKWLFDSPPRSDAPINSLADATAIMEENIEAFHNRFDGRIHAWTMPVSTDGASPELLVEAKRLADKHNTAVSIHVINLPGSLEAHHRKYGMRPVEHLDSLGVLGPNVQLSHAIGLDDSEMDCIARTGTKLVMCPSTALKFGMGTTSIGRLPELLKRGICVGIGTDNCNSSNQVDVMRSIYLVATLYKDALEDPTAVSAETAFEMATIRGAEALCLDKDIGSIEVGKKADLVLFDTTRPEWNALHNLVNNLVYSVDGRSVHTVLVDGKIVVEAYKTLFVDEAQLGKKVQQLGENLLARTGSSFPQRWPVV